ncbi:DUF4268 domain-containing protein [Peptoniphilus sp. KCTC 25270]|uniref:DUF4268 domain-containing protein n=1 Tax=Peptoniphilus sp. KCTC 25270 TaxID=2897414 RepID=UPI001E44FFF6|nr:DUF4268 domain-containing protein [Peptoniphilus sp. KCTC 25270]MCD1147835.1 DUF4268 domain-containing protein [Peptoniphilus sp. KCTC 25270]
MSSNIPLGRLKEVDIRELWAHEQYNFSNWLAKEENIELLNETVGLTLTDIDKEVYVGSYRCDLVAVDETTDIKIIIENQLDSTDHDHLGKIITYASGLDANVIIWIVKEAREEHKSAIEWLNNNMAKEISFFLLEIKAYRIGDSLPAPMFKVVEKPNDFIKSNKSVKDGDLSKTQAERLNFWTEFNRVVTENGKPFNVRKATTDHWYDVAIGTSDAHISITLVNKDGTIGVELYVRDCKDLFDNLYEHKEEIENKLGFNMHWERLDDKKASRIKSYIPGLNFNKQGNYPELMNLVIERVVLMRNVFKGYL